MKGGAGLLAGMMLAITALPGGAAAQSNEAQYRLVVVLPGGDAMSGYGTFIDPAGIGRDGDLRTFASVQAFTAPPAHPELSEVAYIRVGMRANCATRMLETLRFSGLAADGRTIRDGPANNTQPSQVPPGSPGAAMVNFVCDGRLEPAMERVRALTLREILDAARRIRETTAGGRR